MAYWSLHIGILFPSWWLLEGPYKLLSMTLLLLRGKQMTLCLQLFTESQNHRIVGVGRDLCGSSSPTPKALPPESSQLENCRSPMLSLEGQQGLVNNSDLIHYRRISYVHVFAWDQGRFNPPSANPTEEPLQQESCARGNAIWLVQVCRLSEKHHRGYFTTPWQLRDAGGCEAPLNYSTPGRKPWWH